MSHPNAPRSTTSTPASPPDAESVDVLVVHERRRWTNLSFTQAVGASMAAATAAALGSRLGVVGTVAGAALISLISVVAGSLYTESLNRTRQKLVAMRPATSTSTSTTAATARPVDAPPSERSARTGHVGRLLVASAGVFLVAAATVTGWELVTGSSLSGDGSTTIGQVARGGSGGSGSTGTDGGSTGPSDPQKTEDTGTDQDTPTPTDTPTEEPSSTPTEEPTTDPSQVPTPSEPPPSPGSAVPSPQADPDLSTTG